MTTGSSDRDPLGKQALFSPPTPTKPAENRRPHRDPRGQRTRDGVKALYSLDTEPRFGTVMVECSECLEHTRISVLDASARIWGFSLWIPLKRFSRWLSCPACHRRTWCRIRWTG